MLIEIPQKLTPVSAVKFSRYLFSLEEADEYSYDFKNMQHCHPFGLLVVANAIRYNIKKYSNSTHIPLNTQSTQGGQFAASFGFYSSIGFDIGENKEETDIGDGYIPIKSISKAELNSKYLDATTLNDKIVRHAGELTQLLMPYKSREVQGALQYCFREIIRNTFEHANVDNIWVCGQYWPSREEAEIALLDEGIGIYESLKSNPYINVSSCKEANGLALQPGLSRTLGFKQKEYDIWQNSGYGLYVASTLCAMCGGYFLVNSGDSCMLINKNKTTNYDTKIFGTAIGLNIKTDSKQLRNFGRTLSIIVEEGERKAKENGEKRILSASKVTTIASMIRHIETTVEERKTYQILEAKNGIIPLNSIVDFSPISVNSRGEISGTFMYNGEYYEGRLLNVDAVNRRLYVEHKKNIQVLVRNAKNGIYTLLEPHRYNKMMRASKYFK